MSFEFKRLTDNPLRPLFTIDNGDSIVSCETCRARALQSVIQVVGAATLFNNYHPLFLKLDDMYSLKRHGRDELKDLVPRILKTLGSLKYREYMDYVKEDFVLLNQIAFGDTRKTIDKNGLPSTIVRLPQSIITTGKLTNLVLEPMLELLHHGRMDMLLSRLRFVPKSKIFIANIKKLEELLSGCDRASQAFNYGSLLTEWYDLLIDYVDDDDIEKDCVI